MRVLVPRQRISHGTKLSVVLTRQDVELITEHTFADPELLSGGTVDGPRLTISLSLDDIEELQGFVAAEANHTKGRKLREQLDKVFLYLQSFLDSYDDQADFS